MSNNLSEKIVIQEKDITVPVSRPNGSTDIPFIPGMLGLNQGEGATCPVVPTLFTSVREFNYIIGEDPYVFTNADVSGYEFTGLEAGDVDPSYVIAKHLLTKGMSVVYYPVNNTSNEIAKKLETGNLFDQATAQDATLTNTYDNTVMSVSGDSLVITQVDATITLTLEEGKDTAYVTIPYTAPADVNKVAFSFANPYVRMTAVQVESAGVWTTVSSVDVSSNTTNIRLVFTGFAAKSIEISSTDLSVYDVTYDQAVSKIGYLYNSVFAEDGVFNTIADKSLYSVKYLTTGGYPSVYTKDGAVDTTIAAKMRAAAKQRGDCVALIDYQRCDDTSPVDFYSKMNAAFCSATDSEFTTMMYPYAEYALNDVGVPSIALPASFAYMNCLSTVIKSSPNWLAVAGVARGKVPNIVRLLTPNGQLSNMIAEDMQPKFGKTSHSISINCITDVRPYGLTLWGNRTLKPMDVDKGTTATHFLNIRNMVSDIKKLLYTTAKKTMFEQNSDSLWLTFKAGISPLLDQLKSGEGLKDYKIIKNTTRYDGSELTRGEISATVRVMPVYAVEYFELTVEITDNDVTVS